MTNNPIEFVKMAYYKQPCDSYFVESYDSHKSENAKTLDVRFRQQRQLIIAEELCEIAREEYLEDQLKHMEDMEVSLGDCFRKGILTDNS